MKKPRGDAKLKVLAPEKQGQIIAWLNTGTREAARRRVQTELGISVGGSALSEFYSWYHLTKKLEEASEFADELARALAQNKELNLDDTQLSQAAQAAFEVQALKEGDKDFFLGLRLARQRDAKLKLDRDRVELAVEKFRDAVEQRKAAITAELGKAKAAGGLTAETLERIEQELKLL